MNEPAEQSTEICNFFTKLEFNENEINFGLCIRNLNAIAPQLKKLDVRREFFTIECEQQLNKLNCRIFGPFKTHKKGVYGNQLYNLFVHLAENEMSDDVSYLCALFVYSQLNTSLLTGHTASPNVKTNRARLRVFIEKVSKKSILLNEYIESEKSIVDAETLLADVIANDKIEEHCKTAILLGNIYKAVIGNNEFSTMNKKKPSSDEPKPTIKKYKGTVKSASGGSGKAPETDDIIDIHKFSKTVYVEKPEVDAGSVITYEVYETSETALVSPKECKRFTQTKSAIENNYPQNHQRVLKNKEAKIFYEKLLCQFDLVDGIEQKKAILGMIFILLIGLDDTWLADIVLVDGINDYHQLNRGKILVSTLGYLQFYQIELAHAYHPPKKEQQCLKSHKNQIVTLPLPLSIIPILLKIKVLMTSLEFNVDTVIYDEEFTKMRTKLKKRFTNDKLREFSFNLYYRESNSDEVYATLLKPVSPYLIPSSCYYTPAHFKVLEGIHTKAVTKVFGECATSIETDSDIYIGSKLCINPEPIQQLLSTLKSNVKKNIKGNRTPAELISAHNNYVLYVSTVLLITSGHRPVNEIFDDINHFFIDEVFALIGDKSVGKNHNLRLVTLCETAKQQINFYLEHLENMSNRISKFDMETAGKLKALIEPDIKQSQPFLLLLNIDDNGKIKTQGVCKKDIEIYWVGLELPANFYRHFMCDALKENSVPRELINFFMGHFFTGQNLLNPYSAVKPKLLIEKLSDEIEKVASALNLQAIRGMFDGNSDESGQGESIKPIFPKKNAFGTNKRREKIDEIDKEATRLVLTYLDEKHPLFYTNTNKKLSNSVLDKMREYAMSTGKNLKSRVLDGFNLAIKKRARSAHRRPEKLFYLKSSDEKSSLKNDFVINAQQYLVFKDAILSAVINKVGYTKTNEKKCVDKLVLTYLYCLSIDLPYVLSPTDFYHLILQDHAIVNDALCFEFTYKNYGFVRYFPNSDSIKHIRKLKSQLSKTVPSKKTINIALRKIITTQYKQNTLFPKSIGQLKKCVKTGWIFNQSPAFNEYRKMKAFHPLPPSIRNLEKNNG